MGLRQSLKKPSVWVFTTYFAEGFPYMVVRVMTSVFFTDIGMSERFLGYLNYLGFPWNLKFLWAPFVDIFGSRRGWMKVVQSILTLLMASVALWCFWNAHHPGALPIWLIIAIFGAMAFVAATNDIAIDGYYMEGITDPKTQAALTGYRVMAYRLSMVAAKFGVILAVGALTKSVAGGNSYLAWSYGFGASAVTMAILSAYHLIALPRMSKADPLGAPRKKVWHEFLISFASFLEITPSRATIALITSLSGGIALSGILTLCGLPVPQIASYSVLSFLLILLLQARGPIILALLFIIFYKIGDEVIFSMGTPFLKRYLLVTNVQLAWMTGLVGLLGAIAGTTLGGLWIKATGLKKAIWPLTLIMNVNILAYVWLAYHKPLATSMSGLLIIGAVYCYEQIAAGLGNAVIIVFILRTCKPDFKAGHYAIGSAFMSVFSTVFGGMGGVIVENIGYRGLFLTGFLVSIPSMALIFFVKMQDEDEIAAVVKKE